MLINGERRLATVRRVVEKQNIPDADRIEAVRVDGWWVVTRKNEFELDEQVVYVEVDSWVPNTIAPFLSKGKKPKEYNNVPGARLKTVRLRKQLSQGLLLPRSILRNPPNDKDDVTEELGIQKWERPLSADQIGTTKGSFPYFLRKTDQERIQNIPGILKDLDRLWEVSLKLDGSSTTIYAHEGFPGVCSRNLDLRLSAKNNRFVEPANRLGYIDILMGLHEHTGLSYALQAELMGPGIQGNREKLTESKLFIFDIWNIATQSYIDPFQRVATLMLMKKASNVMIVPMMPHIMSLRDLGVTDMKDMLALPDKIGPAYFSTWAQPIEGLVFKAMDGKDSFKVINNNYLEHKK